jgi:hypothetical protein
MATARGLAPHGSRVRGGALELLRDRGR